MKYWKHIRKSWIAGLMAVGACSPAAEKEAEKEQIVLEEAEEGTSLLWEVTGNGLNAPSYLFGTIHIIPKDKFVTGPSVEEAFNRTEELVLEIGNIRDTNAQLGMVGQMSLDSGSIKDHMSKEQYETLLHVVDSSLDISPELFEMQYGKMRPFGLYQLMVSAESGFGDNKSYEMYFMDLAFQRETKTSGLETMQEQLNIFNELSYSDVADQLISTLRAGESGANEMEELVNAYVSFDLGELERLTLSSDDPLTEHMDAFLYDRNARWIPTLDSLMHEKPCFVAVGAAHLPGEKGVIQLLEKEGYTVRPIRIK